jgi:hypothetical protein
MADSEQGSAPSETLDSLASFLADNPEADASGPAKEEKQQTEAAPSTEDNVEAAEEITEGTEETEETTEAKAEEEKTDEAASLKFKVPVKGENGEDQTVEVDQKELIAGYQRHADYTRKTQELSNREREVTQKVAERLNEGQAYYMQQAQLAQAAITQLAGLKSADEMAQLAVTDPATWVQESQREQRVRGVLTQLEQTMQAEQQRQQAEAQAAKERDYQATWQVLTKEGIDRPALKKIFDVMLDHYKVPAERIANVSDPILVRIMRDAAAYRELQTRKTVVSKKVAEAPRLPAQRQTVPASERVNKSLNARFASGKAKLDDLAAYLHNNSI